MNTTDLISLCRIYLFDKDGQIWTDAELGRMIRRAAEEYSRDTLAFHAEFDFVPDSDGTYRYPSALVRFNAGWNAKGDEVLPSSAGELYRSFGCAVGDTGDARYIYDDMSTAGAFALSPNPAGESEFTVFSPPYGTLTDGYGVDCYGYGVDVTETAYEFQGDAMYSRIAAPEEIKDYMALVYHVLGQAYGTDSEFSSPKASVSYYGMYSERVSAFSHVRRACTGRDLSSTFY